MDARQSNNQIMPPLDSIPSFAPAPNPPSFEMAESGCKSKCTRLSFELIMRVLAPGFALGAVVTLAISKPGKSSGYKLNAHFTYSPAFEFLLGANAIVLVFSLWSIVALINKTSTLFNEPRHPKIGFFLMLDMAMIILLVSACGAATAVYHVSLRGNVHTGWKPYCDRVGEFCGTLVPPLIGSYLACLALILTMLSSANHLRKIEASVAAAELSISDGARAC